MSRSHSHWASAEALLSDVAWLRRLARQLVRDASSAEDLAQETLVTALLSAPSSPEPGGLRRWLARVLRNRVTRERRGAARRAQREARSRPPGEVPGPEETLERTLLHGALAQAVHSLPEDQRVVVLLRYWDDLSPQTIAQRLGLPAGTVRSRLTRARRALGQDLDRRFGERERWLGVLATWVRSPGASVPLVTTLLMSKPLLILVPSLAVLILVLAWNRGRPAGDSRGSAAPLAGASVQSPGQASPPAAPGPEDVGSLTGSRARLEAQRASLAVRLLERDTRIQLAGRCWVRLAGEAESQEREVELTASGAQPLSLEPGRELFLRFEPASPLMSPGEIEEPALEPGEQREIVLRTGQDERLPLHLRFVDAETRAPLEGVELWVVEDRPGEGFAGLRVGSQLGRSDAEGLALARFPHGTPQLVGARRSGYSDLLLAPQRGHYHRDQARTVGLGRAAKLEPVAYGPRGEALESTEFVATVGLRELLHDTGPSVWAWHQDARWTARAGSDGRGSLVVPGRLELDLTAHHPQLGVRGPVRVRLDAGEVLPWRFDFQSPGRVRGRAFGVEGRPLSKAQLLAWPAGGSDPALLRDDGAAQRFSADDRGSFDVELAPGRWRLGPRPSPSDPEEILIPRTVELGPGETIEGFDLISELGRPVAGRALDAAGQALESGWVLVESEALDEPLHVPCSGGVFRSAPLPAGPLELTLHVGRQRGPTVAAWPGQEDVELRFPHGLARLDLVLATADGTPPGNCRAWLVSAGAVFATGRVTMPESTLPRERLSIEDVPPGRYRLLATTHAGYAGVQDDVEVSAEPADEALKVTLEPGARLHLILGPATAPDAVQILRGDLPVAAPSFNRSGRAWVQLPPGRVEVLADGVRIAVHELDARGEVEVRLP